MDKETARGGNSDIVLSDHDQHTHGLRILANIIARHHAKRSSQLSIYTIRERGSRGGKNGKET